MASGAPNVDLFDAYFRRADLDPDGRISGAEAVSFFQGSGLPKQVLAQVQYPLLSPLCTLIVSYSIPFHSLLYDVRIARPPPLYLLVVNFCL